MESIFYTTRELMQLTSTRDHRTLWKVLKAIDVPVTKVGNRRLVKKKDMRKHINQTA